MKTSNLLGLPAKTLGELNGLVYPFTYDHTPNEPFLIKFTGPSIPSFNQDYQLKVLWPRIVRWWPIQLDPFFEIEHLKTGSVIQVAYDGKNLKFYTVPL